MKWRMARFSAASAVLDPVSPMCGPTKARFLSSRQKVVLSMPPRASTVSGLENGMAMGSGTKPRLRRIK